VFFFLNIWKYLLTNHNQVKRHIEKVSKKLQRNCQVCLMVRYEIQPYFAFKKWQKVKLHKSMFMYRVSLCLETSDFAINVLFCFILKLHTSLSSYGKYHGSLNVFLLNKTI